MHIGGKAGAAGPFLKPVCQHHGLLRVQTFCCLAAIDVGTNCGPMHRRKTASLFDHGETECFRGLKVDGQIELVEARQAGQRPSPPNELRSCLISGLSYGTTFNKELWIKVSIVFDIA